MNERKLCVLNVQLQDSLSNEHVYPSFSLAQPNSHQSWMYMAQKVK